jgi:replicative DNA helicase
MKPVTAPHSIEAELAVIGTILCIPSCVFDIADRLRPEYFFVEEHALVITTFVELVQENTPPDTVNVLERLRFRGLESKVGGVEGLRKYQDYASSPENVSHWANQIKHYWELRLVVEKCSELAERGRKVAGANLEEFLRDAEETFRKLADARLTKGLIPSSDVVRETIQELDRVMNNPGNTSGVPSGFVDLDQITAGFQPSDLVILAARPAMGKTSLALNFAANAAINAKRYVAFFSLEMSKIQLMQRMLSTAARVPSHKFRKGDFTGEELTKLYPEAQSFNTDRLMIDDSPGISLFDLTSRCRAMKREKGACDMVIVDYLQLMTAGGAGGKNANREREISIISMGLKNLAKELSCPVIALAQLNRGLEQRPDKRPKPSDLRESGSIEQDADQIMFVYRDEVYNRESTEKGIAEIIIGKNRHGPTDSIKLAFQSEFTSFHNLAKI